MPYNFLFQFYPLFKKSTANINIESARLHNYRVHAIYIGHAITYTNQNSQTK